MYRNRYIVHVYRSDYFYSLVVEADFYGDASRVFLFFLRKVRNVYCHKYLDGDSNVKHHGRSGKRYVQCSSS